MKRILCVFLFLLFDVILFCTKANVKPIEPSFRLKNDELAITFLSKDELLLTNTDGNYLWQLKNKLYHWQLPITRRIHYGTEAKIGKIKIKKDRIIFKNLTFCIDDINNCDIAYLYSSKRMNTETIFFTFQDIYNPNYLYDLYYLTEPTTIIWSNNQYNIVDTFYTLD